jgi:hypothetical protein
MNDLAVPRIFAPLAPSLAPALVPPTFDDDYSVYPADFPIPDRSPYTYGVDMGVVRSQFAAGNARQRRVYTIMPHMLALSFHMRMEDLFVWQSWVNAFAYTWIHCPVATMYAGEPPGAEIRYETLRFAGDLAITCDGWDLYAVTVPAELSNDAHTTAPPVALGGWLVGGRPAAPSSDWWIGGTPAAPAPLWVEAGTPGAPSSL